MAFIQLWMAIAATVSDPTLAEPVGEQPAIEYGCNDIVVVGRLNNVEGSYKPVDTGNDFIGAGWIAAQVQIKRVLTGQETRGKVRAKYLAHAPIAENEDFLMVLMPTSEGSYTILDFINPGKNDQPHLSSKCP